jgi:hypothetical protein
MQFCSGIGSIETDLLFLNSMTEEKGRSIFLETILCLLKPTVLILCGNISKIFASVVIHKLLPFFFLYCIANSKF